MTDVVHGWYPWIKALHVIAVIAWMAGMLYLPRLFVYHCAAAPGSELSETLKVMERRLLRAIMNPAFVAAWGVGGPPLLGHGRPHGWRPAKLAPGAPLGALRHLVSARRKEFAAARY